MRVLGLTGGIGMGKSAVADFLRRRGERVVDTDVLAREAVGEGSPSLEQIRCEFGPEVFAPGGELDRSALARVVFANPERRKALEGILHPVIRAAWKERVRQAGEEGLRRVVVVIPLLFETGAEREVDETICVACSAATQRERLLKRGWTAGEIEARVAAQWPVARKMDAADRVIWSEGSLDVTEEQASRILC